jgi:hypothetical protein
MGIWRLGGVVGWRVGACESCMASHYALLVCLLICLAGLKGCMWLFSLLPSF